MRRFFKKVKIPVVLIFITIILMLFMEILNYLNITRVFIWSIKIVNGIPKIGTESSWLSDLKMLISFDLYYRRQILIKCQINI